MAGRGRPERAVGRSRSRAIVWISAGVFVALAEGAVAWAARGVDELYGRDPYWLTAAYTEPSRTIAISIVAVLTIATSLGSALSRHSPSWRRVLLTVAGMISGLAICFELGTAVHFNAAVGELYVHTLLFRRSKVSLGKGERTDCDRGDFSSPFAWRFNGTSIHPRLLPFPYDSSAVVGRLLRRCPSVP